MFVSGLRINYYKSKLIGVNISFHLQYAMENFLSCKIEGSSFPFLGIQIDTNLHCISSWRSLIDRLKAHISCWTCRFLNLGGE